MSVKKSDYEKHKMSNGLLITYPFL